MADEENQDEGDVQAAMEPEKSSGGGGGGNSGPLISLLLILNTIGILGVGFFQYQQHLKEKDKPSVKDVISSHLESMNGQEEEDKDLVPDQKDIEGQLLPLDNFTANLAQGDGPRRYVRLTVVLKFSNGSNPEEFKARRPQIRDTVISILNTKRPRDLLNIEGKQYLKEEVKSNINTFLNDGEVTDVYYTGFQIN